MLHEQISFTALPTREEETATTLPDRLQEAIEYFSGYCMDDVHVHYNSARPASVQALAYAQGTDIFLAPGQERYLPHEAWHVVQQKQGRVPATLPGPDDIAINDDQELEEEADRMAILLMQAMNNGIKKDTSESQAEQPFSFPRGKILQPVIQRVGLVGLTGPNVYRLQGGEVSLQNAIMGNLNQKAEAAEKTYSRQIQVMRLCSVEIIQAATDLRTELTAPILKVPHGLEAGYDFIKNDEMLCAAIMGEVWTTLQKSGQLDYIITNNLINEEWRVFVDVDFYHRRSLDTIGFHKDTIGRSLFVNLNYNNKVEIVGPEYIVNPPAIAEHDEHIKPKLPAVFFADMVEVRATLKEADEIKLAKIPPYGIISWVDELVHHSTPFRGHRGITAGEAERMSAALEQLYKDLISIYQTSAALPWLSRQHLESLGASSALIRYLLKTTGVVSEKDLKKYRQLIASSNPQEAQQLDLLILKMTPGVDYPFAKLKSDLKLSDQDCQYLLFNAGIATIPSLCNELAGLRQLNKTITEWTTQHPKPLTKKKMADKLLFNPEQISLLISLYNKPNLDTVNLAGCEDHCDISTDSALFNIPILRRQMSMELSSNSLPLVSDGKRQFLRTWVQTIRRQSVS